MLAHVDVGASAWVYTSVSAHGCACVSVCAYTCMYMIMTDCVGSLFSMCTNGVCMQV